MLFSSFMWQCTTPSLSGLPDGTQQAPTVAAALLYHPSAKNCSLFSDVAFPTMKLSKRSMNENSFVAQAEYVAQWHGVWKSPAILDLVNVLGKGHILLIQILPNLKNTKPMQASRMSFPMWLVVFPKLLVPRLQWCSTSDMFHFGFTMFAQLSEMVNVLLLMQNASTHFHPAISRSGKHGQKGAWRPHVALGVQEEDASDVDNRLPA